MKIHHITACVLFAILLIAAVVTACNDGNSTYTPAEEQTPATPTWKKVWEENFSGKQLDPTVWRRVSRGPSDWNNNMSTSDAVFAKTDTSIILKGIVRPDTVDDPWSYIVGGIETRGLKKFVPPFRVEVRARTTTAQGSWPAIWMMPFAESPGWPDGGEIDIMERLNHDKQVYHSVHNSYYDTDHNDNPRHSGLGYIGDNEWNVYAVAVTRNAVVWFINGNETFRYERLDPEVKGQFPFYTPQFLRIDMQLGGAWVGPVDTSQLPVEMEVDWVRYYQYK